MSKNKNSFENFMLNIDSFSEEFTGNLLKKFDSIIADHIIECNQDHYNYTTQDLDTKRESGESLREFIVDTENEFNLEHANLDVMTDEQFNEYLKKMDSMWVQ